MSHSKLAQLPLPSVCYISTITEAIGKQVLSQRGAKGDALTSYVARTADEQQCYGENGFNSHCPTGLVACRECTGCISRVSRSCTSFHVAGS